MRKSADYLRVRRLGKSYVHPLIVLIALPNGLEQARFAVSAGRTVGNAVLRNRAKRVIRAALQSMLSYIQPGWDLIVLARRPITNANYHQVFAALKDLLSSAGVYVQPHEAPNSLTS